MTAAIRTSELTKDFAVGFWRKRPYRALDHLTLDVQTGEVFGFLGPNGAGKTTTLKLLMQLVMPTAGRAEILGRPLGDLDVKRRLGYLPENPYFYDYLTAEELMVYFARLFGYSGAASAARGGDKVGQHGAFLGNMDQGAPVRRSLARARASQRPRRAAAHARDERRDCRAELGRWSAGKGSRRRGWRLF